jgi:hypothetical protein
MSDSSRFTSNYVPQTSYIAQMPQTYKNRASNEEQNLQSIRYLPTQSQPYSSPYAQPTIIEKKQPIMNQQTSQPMPTQQMNIQKQQQYRPIQ